MQGIAGAGSPLFGRPIWSYVNVVKGPQLGPQPRLAKGTGNTAGASSLPGNAAQLPGYLTDNEYFPSPFSYDPGYQPSFRSNIPRSINTGDDGVELVSTYRAHDWTPADRFFNQNRRAPLWFRQEFPPDFRNLLAYQQVQVYRMQTLTRQPRVLPQSDYFLGYQVNRAIVGQIGQTTLGNLGSQ